MSALEADDVEDRDWSLVLLDLFEDFYFATLQSTHPFPSICPPSWHAAHTLAESGAVDAEEALLLALNAHINNDLPQALASLLEREWPARPSRLARRRNDLWTIVDVIAETATVEGGRWSLPRIIRAWRADVWDNSLLLLTAATPRWQSAIAEDIEHAAMKRAHLIACLGGMREHLLVLPTAELHRVFDRHRGRHCRCGLVSAACDSWLSAPA